MLEAAMKEQLRQRYRIAVIIGLAMVYSLLAYVALVELLRWRLAPFRGLAPFPAVDILRYLLLALSVANFYLIRLVRDRLLPGERQVVQAPGSPGGSSERIGKLQVAATVAYAQCEAVAVFGLLLFLLAGRRADFYGFLALSVVSFAVYFPRYGQWEEWIQGE